MMLLSQGHVQEVLTQPQAQMGHAGRGRASHPCGEFISTTLKSRVQPFALADSGSIPGETNVERHVTG